MAADDLPGPVVTFLNVIGVPWPYLNEDSIRQFATMVRGFSQAVEQTHQDATTAVESFAQAYRGPAALKGHQVSERATRNLVHHHSQPAA